MPLKLNNESELREAQAALFNVNSTSGWVLLNYVGPSTIHFSAGGEGGPEEIGQQFEVDQIQYGLIRIVIPGEGTRDRIRDVFVNWIGPGVGIIEKGKKAALLGDAQNYLQPFHADVRALNKEKFTTENVINATNSGHGEIS